MKKYLLLLLSVAALSAAAHAQSVAPILSTESGGVTNICEFKSTTGSKIMAPCVFADMKLVGKIDMNKMLHSVTPTMPPVMPTPTTPVAK